MEEMPPFVANDAVATRDAVAGLDHAACVCGDSWGLSPPRWASSPQSTVVAVPTTMEMALDTALVAVPDSMFEQQRTSSPG